MVDQVGSSGGEQEHPSPAPLAYQEFYVATDGRQWLIEAEVRWSPCFCSQLRLMKLPERIPVPLPANLPYLEVVPRNLREAALDGNYDLPAITRYCLQRCLVTIREYVERFGDTL